ncbi:MAG: TRAP transporter large permease [Eubacteriales bacterium]|nr:TRAP transporter large permease [Eubacteriales bacterium]
MIWVMLVILFIFMLLGFPMLVGMIMAPLVSMVLYAPQADLIVLIQQMVSGISTYVLLAVPMFILAADIMCHGEMADRLLNFVGSLVKHVPGGLAITAGGTCTIFGAISGSTQATLVAIGKPMFKPMREVGYKDSHIIALLMSNANIALLIPPSICMIMFCVCTGESVGDLFLAGFGPGIMMFVGFSLYDFFYAKKNKIVSAEKSTGRERGIAFRKAILPLGFPVLVLGGIYSGIFSPTEAAAASVFYALILEGLVYRTLKWSDIPKIGLSTGFVTASVFILIAGGQAFSWIVSYAQIPQMLSETVFSHITSGTGVLLFVSVFFFIACMFVDSIPVIIIMSPIVYPVAVSAGVDPMQLGIIITMQSAIGCITPPFGCNIFTACGIFQKDFKTVVSGLAPYMIINLCIAIALVFFPDLALISLNLFR